MTIPLNEPQPGTRKVTNQDEQKVTNQDEQNVAVNHSTKDEGGYDEPKETLPQSVNENSEKTKESEKKMTARDRPKK
jgi:hypothetical protein